MTPYASRLAGGRVACGAVTATLPGNMPPETEPLHGIGWRRPWLVGNCGSDTATLVFDHSPDADWPWALNSTQTFQLLADEDAVVMTLGVSNTDTRPFPASLGLHPYFDIAGARLRLAVSSLWETDAKGIPLRQAIPPVIAALQAGADPATLGVDNCFEGWDAVACLSWPEFEVVMTASATGPAGPIPITRAQIYTPAGQAFFCMEPVTARTNAFNADEPVAEGAVMLEPGQSLSVSMMLAMASR